MDNQQLPDFDAFEQHLHLAAQEAGKCANLPNVTLGQEVTRQLQGLAEQMQTMQQQMQQQMQTMQQQMQQQMQAGFADIRNDIADIRLESAARYDSPILALFQMITRLSCAAVVPTH